jgi:hypothetical protein
LLELHHFLDFLFFLHAGIKFFANNFFLSFVDKIVMELLANAVLGVLEAKSDSLGDLCVGERLARLVVKVLVLETLRVLYIVEHRTHREA